MPAETTHQAAVIAEDLVRYERVKKKGITNALIVIQICNRNNIRLSSFFSLRICKITHKLWDFESGTSLRFGSENL